MKDFSAGEKRPQTKLNSQTDKMNRKFIYRRTVLKREILAEVTVLDQGVHILLTGGQRTHVGSVSMCNASKDSKAMTLCLPGHKEPVITEHWCAVLSEKWKCPVTVACGIHYDSITHDEIREILKETDLLLQQTAEGSIPMSPA